MERPVRRVHHFQGQDTMAQWRLKVNTVHKVSWSSDPSTIPQGHFLNALSWVKLTTANHLYLVFILHSKMHFQVLFHLLHNNMEERCHDSHLVTSKEIKFDYQYNVFTKWQTLFWGSFPSAQSTHKRSAISAGRAEENSRLIARTNGQTSKWDH